ncbi:MAG: TetR/AcrR family transcriptional regulator [Pseudomonadota bacterium]
MPQAPARGRPRDHSKDAAILKVAAQCFQRDGFARTAIDDIAAQAGVGKQSIYRRWPSKAELALAVLRREADDSIPTDGGLETFLRSTGAALERNGALLRTLMAAAQSDASLRRALKAQLIEPRRKSLALVLGDVVDGERQWMIAALFGAVWYRLLLDEPLDESFATGMAALFPQVS